MADEFDQYARKPGATAPQGDEFSQYARTDGKQLSQPNQPTGFDRFVSGVTGNIGASDNPEDPIHQGVEGVKSNLGRTTQAWHDMFTGKYGPTTAAEMIPFVGPAAVDAGRLLATPGRRMEGLGASTGVVAPFAAHGIEMPSSQLNLAQGDIPTPSAGQKLLSAAKTAGPDVGKGVLKIATGAGLDYAIPGEARIGALVGTAPLIRSGVRQIGRGVKSGVADFRGPQLGPEPAIASVAQPQAEPLVTPTASRAGEPSRTFANGGLKEKIRRR